MKNILPFLFILVFSNVYSQKDSLNLGDRYLEDQLYFGVTYNQLFDQPAEVKGSGFSYGFNTGYIKDIPIVKSGKLALGVGIGYAFDSFNHGLKVSTVNNDVVFEVDGNLISNKLRLHYIELPIEFRWRTSTANRFKFWRIYTGVKLSYNIKNTFSYSTTTNTFDYSNVNRFNKLQYGLTISAGYAAFNFNLYYGLTPLLKDATVGANNIPSKVLRIGFIFYFL